MADRSSMRKLFVVLLVAMVAVFMVGINFADAHRVPGCRNDTPQQQNPHCAEGHHGDNPGECSDGVDNDGDGLIDGDDPDCEQPPPPPTNECTDGVDNDNDGATDGFDRDCDGGSTEESGSDEPECSDGVDNDGDTKTDFAEGGDPDCTDDDDDSEASAPPTQCSDGADNDNDGATDLFDRDCSGPDDDTESGSDEPQCSDGIDNDGDTKTDFGENGDPDCTDDDDDSEAGATPPECSDGIDNDGDGPIDGADDGCSGPDDTDEGDPPVVEPTCGDPDGDAVDHSNFDPDSNEGGLVSSIVHDVDQALPPPLGGDGGVVTEVNCAIVVTVEEIVGIDG